MDPKNSEHQRKVNSKKNRNQNTRSKSLSSKRNGHSQEISKTIKKIIKPKDNSNKDLTAKLIIESHSQFSMRYSIINSMFVKKNKNKIAENQLITENVSRNQVYPNSIKVLDNMSSIRNILFEKSNKAQNGISYRNYAYLCQDTYKSLVIVEYQNENIIIREYEKKTILKKIVMKRVLYVEQSQRNRFLVNLVFNQDYSKKSLILEIPNSNEFLDILIESVHFSQHLIKKSKKLRIEEKDFFSQNSL